jgi:hypothetical protein
MSAARTTTAGIPTDHGTSSSGAHGAAPASRAPPPTAALARGTSHASNSNVFQSPLSAGGADAEQRRRAQRLTQVAAIGTVAALAAIALIAWRRARR